MRAFSIAATQNLFSHDLFGSLHDWQIDSVVFAEAQKTGIRSKIWATGPGFNVDEDNRTVYDIAFSNVSIHGTCVTEENFKSYFAIGQECVPDSFWNETVGNVRNINFFRHRKHNL